MPNEINFNCIFLLTFRMPRTRGGKGRRGAATCNTAEHKLVWHKTRLAKIEVEVAEKEAAKTTTRKPAPNSFGSIWRVLFFAQRFFFSLFFSLLKRRRGGVNMICTTKQNLRSSYTASMPAPPAPAPPPTPPSPPALKLVCGSPRCKPFFRAAFFA